ncbi:hypothetical protein [Photorhabdus temperata]|nr:hypothetical protein [Photorhabdus temperata]
MSGQLHIACADYAAVFAAVDVSQQSALRIQCQVTGRLQQATAVVSFVYC